MSDVNTGFDSGPRPIDISEKITSDLSRDERLKTIDISFEPITSDEIEEVNNRDFGGNYPYIDTVSSKYGESVDRLGIFINRKLVGYSVGGLFNKDGQILGEAGMTHISPQMRDFGLGSTIVLVMYERLMQQNPDALYAVLADGTGKMQGLHEKLGYEEKGTDLEMGGYPIWIKNFTSDIEKKDFSQQLGQIIDSRIPRLEENTSAINAKVQQVDG